MSYRRKAREVRTVVLAGIATILALLLPFTVLTATPSPGGATVGLAALLALGVPVLIGWGISRGDTAMEQRSVRPVAMLDLGLILTAAITVAAASVTLRVSGASPAGLIAARAIVTYVGLLLAAVPVVSWANASFVPVAYLVGVVVAGRGDDAEHPAVWAWIASREDDAFALVAALATLAAGIVIYLVWGRGD
jgi:hypothetical protein